MTLPRDYPEVRPRGRVPDRIDVRSNRIRPALGAESMKTYQLSAPIQTHHRPATCAEVDCPNHSYGWKTVVDTGTDLGQRQAAFIKEDTTRRHTSYREGDAGVVVFIFEAGQTCFDQHTIPLEREPTYLVKDGDWRGNPRGTRPLVHDSADNWVDDFATHQQRIRERQQRG